MPELVKPAFNDINGNWRKASHFVVLADHLGTLLTHKPQTEFYHGSSALVNGKIVYNLFSQTDTKKHAQEKRPSQYPDPALCR